MIGALGLCLFCGIVAPIAVPGDTFRYMNGPVSWLVSLALGLVGAMVGYLCSTKAPTGIRNRALLTLFYRSGLRVSSAAAPRCSAPSRAARCPASTSVTCCTVSAAERASTSGSIRMVSGTRSRGSWKQARVPITVISALLGHSSIAVTARYLNHLSNNQAIEALEAVELPGLGA